MNYTWVPAIGERFIRYGRLFVTEGAFISNVLDTTTISDWGCIYWQVTQPEGTNVTLATRSGNCEKPDLTGVVGQLLTCRLEKE